MNKNRILLRKGVTLNFKLIARIKELGFQGVYIDDALSTDIEVANVISDELKFKAMHEVTSLFTGLRNKSDARVAASLTSMTSVVDDIVSEILSNRHLMVNIIDIRNYDDYTYSHSINVAVLSVVLGTMLGMNRDTLNKLCMGALIHDIGKVFIDKRLINKNGKLTPEEYEEVKKHSLFGYNYLCLNKRLDEKTQLVALTHHEKYDGNGYPAGLKGENIPLFGRIVCVADVYDALISDRPYRRAWQPAEAIEYILSGFDSMFDPAVISAFAKKVAPYPVGTCVKLSDGRTGIVVENFESCPLRPKIRLIQDGKPLESFIDLSAEALNVTITDTVNI
jgi:HD-GYP domain-containing protein (c-di-GMP phosphodiesterase class II)